MKWDSTHPFPQRDPMATQTVVEKKLMQMGGAKATLFAMLLYRGRVLGNLRPSDLHNSANRIRPKRNSGLYANASCGSSHCMYAIPFQPLVCEAAAS